METCSVEGCDRPMARAGMCSAHYHRKRKGQPLVPLRKKALATESRACLFVGCGRPGTKRGMCPGHYQQDRSGVALRPLRTVDISTPCYGPDCSRPAVCKGLCDGHYQQIRAGRTLAPLQRVLVVCSVLDCGRAIRKNGLCETHYARSLPRRPRQSQRRPSPVRVQLEEGYALVDLFGVGGVLGHARVSCADVPAVSEHRWYLWQGGYAAARIQGRTCRMHRLILDAPDGTEVDHIDGDRLNNQRTNLRLVDKKLQAENKKVRSDSQTGFRSVHFDKKKNLYRVISTKNGVRRGHRHKRLEDAVAEAKALRDQHMTHHNEARSSREDD
jgi:hypothetical protein